MSKLSVAIEKKTGIPESQQSRLFNFLLMFVPAKSLAKVAPYVQIATEAAQEIRDAGKAQGKP